MGSLAPSDGLRADDQGAGADHLYSPADYAPARLREAARYLLDRQDVTEEERRLATVAVEWLRSQREGKAPVKTAEPANSDQSREQQAGPPHAPARQTRKRRN